MPFEKMRYLAVWIVLICALPILPVGYESDCECFCELLSQRFTNFVCKPFIWHCAIHYSNCLTLSFTCTVWKRYPCEVPPHLHYHHGPCCLALPGEDSGDPGYIWLNIHGFCMVLTGCIHSVWSLSRFLHICNMYVCISCICIALIKVDPEQQVQLTISELCTLLRELHTTHCI